MSDAASTTSRTWDRVGIAMGAFVFAAGVQHFVNPDFFNDIVPPWLPPSESFWTYLSGIAELIVGVMLLVPKYRPQGALAAIALFVAVYPANIYMVWDWRDRELSERLVSYGRLPLQFVIIWLAWRVSVTRRSSVTQ
ncbi:MAG: MauE/DoxX family redox-associated membrane protein [Actinomycetota bacterium]